MYWFSDKKTQFLMDVIRVVAVGYGLRDATKFSFILR
jgi:hypothetical protein